MSSSADIEAAFFSDLKRLKIMACADPLETAFAHELFVNGGPTSGKDGRDCDTERRRFAVHGAARADDQIGCGNQV